MLEYLEIENAGPADHLRLDLAPRLNLLTGDNGLGKSFLMDVVWWTYTQYWPYEINENILTGRQIDPGDYSNPRIRYKIHSQEELSQFDRYHYSWEKRAASLENIVVVYSRTDGGFCIFDKLKDIQNPCFALESFEVWEGQSHGRVTTCNGLIRDWGLWQKENGENFRILRDVLDALSPQGENFEPGKLTRIIGDARDIPTLSTPYGKTPVVYASAGVRRIISLAYMLVWAWQEHKIAMDIHKASHSKTIVLIIDELDVHLHPKWQRTIVKSLMKVMELLAPEVKVQIIAATHSPLVMASVEPFFDPARDAWFDLDLNRETGQVEVVKRSDDWYRRGDSDAWLKSEAFDQKSGYAPETEQALDEAKAAMGNPATTREQADAIDAKLRRLLGEMDTFWVDWGYFFEEQGWAR